MLLLVRSILRSRRTSLACALLFGAVASSACGKKKAATDDDDKAIAKKTKVDDDGDGDEKPKKKVDKRKGADDEPSPAQAGEGCKLPADKHLKANWTVTSGCAVETADILIVDEGATLTLQAGVRLAFGNGGQLDIRNGKLVAQGTEDAPVVFTSKSKSPGKGDWAGILFEGKASSGSVLDHVTVEYAGKQSWAGQGSILSNADSKRLTVTNSTFQHSRGDVVAVSTVDGLFEKFEHNTFKDGDGNAMRVPANVVGSIGDGNVFGAPIHVFREVKVSATWPKIDAPYIVEGRLKVGSSRDAVTLTLPEGATLKFNADGFIDLGGDGGSGLIAKNVTFTSASASPAVGDWGGIVFFGKVTSTVLDGCTFEYAGKKTFWGPGVLDFVGGKPGKVSAFKMTHTAFKNVDDPAIRADGGDCGDFGSPASGNTIDKGKFCAKDGG